MDLTENDPGPGKIKRILHKPAGPTPVRSGDEVPCGRCKGDGYTWSSEGGHKVCTECKGTRVGVLK